MGPKINNVISAFANTKARVLLVVILAAIVFTAGISYIRFKQLQLQSGAESSAEVARTPNITSIPGVGQEPPREYEQLQDTQNIQQAVEAEKQGTAAVPTITRVTYLPTGESESNAATSSCSVEELKKAHSAGVLASELRCRGCSIAALKAAGYTAGELCAAGFSAKDLKDAGFTLQELKSSCYSAKDLKAAGFSAAELKNAGYSAGELKAAGFTDQELTAAGFPLPAAGTKDCSSDNLKKLRMQVVEPEKLKSLGCSASALKDAGFSAAELRAAGYSAKDLKDAGFSAKDLRNSGFSAGELKNAGFSAGELKSAGFSASDLKDAGFNAKELRNAGFTGDDLAKAGFSAQDLKAAGYSDGDILRAGLTLPQLQQQTPQAAGNAQAPTELTEPQLPSEGAPAAQGKQAQPEWEKQLEDMRKQQAAQLSSQEYQDRMKQVQQLMSTQANQLFGTWIPLPNQQYVQGATEEVKTAEGEAVAGSQGPQAQTAGASSSAVTGDVYKAGSILFAVLDTGVNSDMHNSPVMATIVSGPLKGSKVLGNFTFNREAKNVLLQFTVLSAPQLKNSIGMNAVAIDPNTAQTALASNVDNHYLLRYGGLFAASFVSGLGQAAQQSAQSVTINSSNGETIQLNGNINTQKSILMGLGDVGTEFANAWRPLVNTPPTVKVNGGTGVGLLLMSDLTIPKT